MALPALNERLAIYKSRAAIPEGKQVKVKGISVTGTGHPFYVFQPSSGQALITLHPRKPVGLPLGEPRSSQYAGDAAKDENLLAGVLKLKTSYADALESTDAGFFDTTSNKDRIRVHDGRQWVLYNGVYWVQYNWQTNAPSKVSGNRSATVRQMEKVLDDLVASGGTVRSAILKLGNNGFIAGDQEQFWTADGRRYRMEGAKWILQEPNGKKPPVEIVRGEGEGPKTGNNAPGPKQGTEQQGKPPTHEVVIIDDGDDPPKPKRGTKPKKKPSEEEPEKIKPTVEALKKRYPTRNNVRLHRTWAGPKRAKSKSRGKELLPANPTSSRPGDRGVKRKKDDIEEKGGKNTTEGHAPENPAKENPAKEQPEPKKSPRRNPPRHKGK